MTNPLIKRIILPEQIPPERVADWHAFLATLPPAWWEGKTAKERGMEAIKLWKEKDGR